MELENIDKLNKQEYFYQLYEWTNKKEKLHNASKVEKKVFKKEISLKVGQIWWYSVGINIGKEIGKTEPFLRPCLIVNNNMGNGLIGIMPIYGGKNYETRFLFKVENYSKFGLTKGSNILLNQFKAISIKRLIGKMNDKKGFPLFPQKNILELINKFKKLF